MQRRERKNRVTWKKSGRSGRETQRHHNNDAKFTKVIFKWSFEAHFIYCCYSFFLIIFVRAAAFGLLLLSLLLREQAPCFFSSSPLSIWHWVVNFKVIAQPKCNYRRKNEAYTRQNAWRWNNYRACCENNRSSSPIVCAWHNNNGPMDTTHKLTHSASESESKEPNEPKKKKTHNRTRERSDNKRNGKQHEEHFALSMSNSR